MLVGVGGGEGSTNNRHAGKAQEKKLRSKTLWVNKGFEKLLCEPEHFEGHVHAQDRMHSEKRPDKSLSGHFWLMFKFSSSRKQMLRQSGMCPG